MAEAQGRLSTAMEQRRVQLRMTWVDVAKKAGLSIAGLSAIRRGERNPTSITRAGIEDALQWAPGSIDVLLAGGEPTPAQSEPERPKYDVDEIRELRDQLNVILDRIEEIQRRR